MDVSFLLMELKVSFGIDYSVVQEVDWVVPASYGLDGFIGTIGTALFYVREFRDS